MEKKPRRNIDLFKLLAEAKSYYEQTGRAQAEQLSQQRFEIVWEGEEETEAIDKQIENTREKAIALAGIFGFALDLIEEYEESGIIDPDDLRVDLAVLSPALFWLVSDEAEREALAPEPAALPEEHKSAAEEEDKEPLSTLVFDPMTNTLAIGERVLNLDPRWQEKRIPLLLFLGKKPNEVISSGEILGGLKKDANVDLISVGNISTVIGRIREVIEEDPENPQLLISKPRVGHQLRARFKIQTPASPEPTLASDQPGQEEMVIEKSEESEELSLTIPEAVNLSNLPISRVPVLNYWVKNPELMQEDVHYVVAGGEKRVQRRITREGLQRLKLLGLLHRQITEELEISKVSAERMVEALQESFKGVSPQVAAKKAGLSPNHVKALVERGILEEGVDFFQASKDQKVYTTITPPGQKLLETIRRFSFSQSRVNYERAESLAQKRWQPEKKLLEPEEVEFNEIETAKLANRIIRLTDKSEDEFSEDFIGLARAIWGDFIASEVTVEDCEDLLATLEEKLTALSGNPQVILQRFSSENPIVFEILLRMQEMEDPEQKRAFIRNLLYEKGIVLKQANLGAPVEMV